MSFNKKKYTVVRNALSKEMAYFCYRYFLFKRQVAQTLFKEKYISPFETIFGIWDDSQVTDTYSHYADLVMEVLLVELLPLMQKATNLKLSPNYSYARIYKKEDILKWYGVSETQAQGLLPWVRIQTMDSADGAQQNTNRKWEKYAPEQIEINNPNASDWIRITGLPAYKVKRILTYQKWTGGFTNIQGLKKVYGITAFDFQIIYPYLKYQSNKAKKMAYQTMRFEDWMALGIFDERAVYRILKLRKEQEGRLTWSEMVIQFDLTEAEAMLLKKRTNLSN